MPDIKFEALVNDYFIIRKNDIKLLLPEDRRQFLYLLNKLIKIKLDSGKSLVSTAELVEASKPKSKQLMLFQNHK